ncbi:cyclophilin-like fold protein [Bordetella sp. 2513F-2]
MEVRITIAGKALQATLEDNAAARDFIAMLPLTLDLEDYSRTEKIAQLPGRLSTAGAPAGMTPAPGDIAYYAPWGNLALFYRDFGHSRGLVKLGRIRGDARMLEAPGPLDVRIEIATTP